MWAGVAAAGSLDRMEMIGPACAAGCGVFTTCQRGGCHIACIISEAQPDLLLSSTSQSVKVSVGYVKPFVRRSLL